MNQSKEKAIIIARVSTLRQEKEGLSLKEIQVPKMREYAKLRNLKVVEEFIFSETADRKIRKKFDEIIKFVKENEDVKHILTYKVDRGTRNFRDAVLFDELRVDYGKTLHFTDDRLVLHKKSSSNELTQWDTNVFLAKTFINSLKGHAYSTIEKKLSKGELPGPAPFGYRNITKTDSTKWVEQEKYEIRIVEQIYSWYITGSYSMTTIKEKLKKEYELDITKTKVASILNNPFYCGKIRHSGKIVPHYYETIITEETFDKAQRVRVSNGNSKGKHKGKPAIYRGLIFCNHCGCVITPEEQKGRFYYHCTQSKGKHGASWLREDELTNQFSNMFESMKVPKNIVNNIVKALKESHKGKKDFYNKLYTQLTAEHKKLETRIESMYEDKLDGRITATLFDKKSEEYRKKQNAIEVKIGKLSTADEDYYISSTYILNLASKAKELFEKANMDQKRELIKIAYQNLELKDRNIVAKANKPFDTILARASCNEWLLG